MQPNEGAAELRAEGPAAPAACSPAAGEEHAALRWAHVLGARGAKFILEQGFKN
jgi:hypothetical protein